MLGLMARRFIIRQMLMPLLASIVVAFFLLVDLSAELQAATPDEPSTASIMKNARPGAAKSGATTNTGSGPVAIEADNGIEWRREDQVYIATGHAKATREALTVNADQLIAHYRDGSKTANGKSTVALSDTATDKTSTPTTSDSGDEAGKSEIYRVDAIGHVVVTRFDQVMIGDHGVYDLDQNVLVMTGKILRLTSPDQLVFARDSLEYWSERKIAVARGNGLARRLDRQVTGDLLTAHFIEDPKTHQDQLSRVDAFGNVRISAPDEVAIGDKGVYNLERDVATLIGNVRVTHLQDQLEGDYAETNMTTGVSRMLSGPAAGQAGAQVKGLLFPKSESPKNVAKTPDNAADEKAGAASDKPPAKPANKNTALPVATPQTVAGG